MYSKQEASKLREEFWTSFGLYMAPVLSAEGEKINWINYKTGEKNIHFRMQADTKTAMIGIEINHSDSGIRQLYFEQFLQLKKILHQSINEEWEWNAETSDENGRSVSRVCKKLEGISVFIKEDWPQIISFFKPRIIALDEFWSNVKYSFEMLR